MYKVRDLVERQKKRQVVILDNFNDAVDFFMPSAKRGFSKIIIWKITAHVRHRVLDIEYSVPGSAERKCLSLAFRASDAGPLAVWYDERNCRMQLEDLVQLEKDWEVIEP